MSHAIVVLPMGYQIGEGRGGGWREEGGWGFGEKGRKRGERGERDAASCFGTFYADLRK